MMKLLVLLLGLANLSALISASCTSSDAPCQAGSGSCTSSVELALQGELQEAINVASYGKYCGQFNRCQAVKGSSKSKSKSSSSSDTSSLDDADVCEIPKSSKSTKGSSSGSKSSKTSKGSQGSESSKSSKASSSKGSKSGKSSKASSSKASKSSSSDDEDSCPAEPCDELDSFCSSHDACLDAQLLVTPPPEGEYLGVPERCNCDVNFVYDLLAEGAAADGPTYLCDDAFYNEPIPMLGSTTLIDILEHEAYFMASPFCCNILKTDDVDDDFHDIPICSLDPATDSVKFGVANTWCEEFVARFAMYGIHICGGGP